MLVIRNRIVDEFAVALSKYEIVADIVAGALGRSIKTRLCESLNFGPV